MHAARKKVLLLLLGVFAFGSAVHADVGGRITGDPAVRNTEA
jgi:hypothetical protein